MIGLLIITHETIGEAYRGLADHFFPNGFPENLHILGVQPDEDQDDIINDAGIRLLKNGCFRWPQGILRPSEN